MPPEIGGGSLLIAWQLSGKRVLIVGGGEIASQRINSILVTDAHITVLSPSAGLHPRTEQLIAGYPTRITYLDGSYEHNPDDLELTKYDMILTALDDVELSRSICHYCRDRRIPVNAADIPDLCDFYFGSQIRDGPLQIMVSTNGNGPRLANLVMKKIRDALSGREGAAIEKVGALRVKLKERAPGVGGAVGKRRMTWMTKLCNEWDMGELGQLNEGTMQKLLDEGWEKDQVPSPRALGLKAKGVSSCPRNNRSPILPVLIGFATGVAYCAAVSWLLRKK
ncbi:siroheme synthase [Macrolepiota fuliginosa MF-IS2]|uniref:precorrin-2 dehydrogenase n=1 Tax=Macrolepiota fuliginosa MF-IS2 TaxID=1400762 RepID=A0A9P6C736_9AGAR|nr:siroheme synthase [Macrolepiota fuliginosa MF-IS2]